MWITDRLVTDRMRSVRESRTGALGRQINRVAYAVLDRLTGRGSEIYFYGGAEWAPGSGGSWGSSVGTVNQPKTSRHPLCILGPIGMAEEAIELVANEDVRGSKTKRYRVELPSDQFASEVWQQLSEQGEKLEDGSYASRASVEALMWVDENLCIRRLSFQPVYAAGEQAIWSTVEFSDFGVSIERSAPNAAELRLS